MDIKNDAQATGWVTLKVKLSSRISAQEWRDDHLFEDWVFCNINDYNFSDSEIVKSEIELSDFDYVEDNNY